MQTKLHNLRGFVNADSATTVIKDFEHQPNVVIACKIHGPEHVHELKQSFCLLHAAYNRRVLYDILLFSTLALSEEDTAALQLIVSPATLTVYTDEQSLHEQLAALTPSQQRTLLNRCLNVSTIQDFTWQTLCVDDIHTIPIQYTWMSEFRSKQIWTLKPLKPYKYMMWFDSDSFPTQVWRQDPVAFTIRNKLVLLGANCAQGKTLGRHGVQERIYKAYKRTLCSNVIGQDARMEATYLLQTGEPGKNCTKCWDHDVVQVHGFLHITDLDFYRLPQNIYWYDVMIGDGKFGRVWDDQLAITVPPAMLAPHRAMDMEAAGINLDVMHNGLMMGKRNWPGGAYLKFWNTEGVEKFPEAQELCGAFIKVPVRRM